MIDTEPNSNMDEFNRLTLMILDRLYDSFPIFTVVGAKDFYEKIDNRVPALLEGTVRFLSDEGFIKYSIGGSAGDGPMYFGVQLTSKGLSILNKSPASLAQKQTIIDKIKIALKTGKTEAFKEALKLVMTEAAKSVGSGN